ncbi:hypothetical protein A5790_10400 [Mycobacterium sp. 852002-51152_SCH6134967]|uniref:PRC-barrel domain containing protein n=1 Tax=Mycobacterium sp. 852002-51152_SCH6134967 TaxID=1834096 RepID=UPI00080071F4|nr:PRC-barrel domain containing protein [Mycobacterium sp. 852002-51152_SCH6134967]OBF94490.1 hypothetical protein A5790_10400 [Mycobacterium sp. 852002-51152_SCH6134967]
MQLSEILGLPVCDADALSVGTVVDVRLHFRDGGDPASSTPQLFGLVVSPHTRSSYLGYERSGVNKPRALAALLRWRHRGTRLVLWQDVARIDSDAVTLRPGFQSYSPVLH